VGVFALLPLAASCFFNAEGSAVDPLHDQGAKDLPVVQDNALLSDQKPDRPPNTDLEVSILDSAIDQTHPSDLPPKLDHNTGPDLGPCQDLTLKYAGSQYVNVLSNSVDLTDNFTVAAWVKPSELNTNFEYQVVSRHSHLLASGYVLMIKQQVPEFRVYHGLLTATSQQSCHCKDVSTKLTQTNVWYHLAGSFSAKTARLFLNGKLIKSCICPKPTVVSHTGGLRVGACSSCFPVKFGFKGLIDDVVVAKTARSTGFDPRQITSLLPCNKVVARWPFAEVTGQSTASLCGGPGGTLGSISLTPDFNDPIWIKGTCLTDR
jgi:Concanavalin A-like lectin/glucanases superfamily